LRNVAYHIQTTPTIPYGRTSNRRAGLADDKVRSYLAVCLSVKIRRNRRAIRDFGLSLKFKPRCRKFDIMDSMLQKLEKYADNLESIVEQRTGELMDEKQKTDMLLHRMLPT